MHTDLRIMWSKLTSHIGVWLGIEEEEHNRRRPMRTSLSLSMLHNPRFGTARPSKSTENLLRVSLHTNGAACLENGLIDTGSIASPSSTSNGTCTSSTPTKKMMSIFSSKKSDKPKSLSRKGTITNASQSNGVRTMSSSSTDELTESLVTSRQPSKNLLSFLRRSRSRSSHRNNDVIISRAVTTTPSARLPTSTSAMDFAHLRRRRPRSAHFDPNTICLPSPEQIVPEQNIDDVYRRIEKLGEGSYAMVYKCENKEDGSIVALKEIKLQFQEGLPFTAIREASLLRALRHANIVSLHDIFHQQKTLTFVFEYMKDDLSRYLDAHPDGLDPFQIKLLLFQLLRGLAFCHTKKILHRDLKPQNLLINEAGELKLADFGLARAKSVPSRTFSHEVVTMWYRPPDVLMGSTEYSTSLDIWGVGCILSEMATGQALFPGRKDTVDQLQRIFRIRGSPNVQKWPEVKNLPQYVPDLYPDYRIMMWPDVHSALAKLKNGQELLTQLLQLNPAERISASAAMLHPYFSNLPAAIHILPPTVSIFTLPQLQPLYK